MFSYDLYMGLSPNWYQFIDPAYARKLSQINTLPHGFAVVQKQILIVHLHVST